MCGVSGNTIVTECLSKLFSVKIDVQPSKVLHIATDQWTRNSGCIPPGLRAAGGSPSQASVPGWSEGVGGHSVGNTVQVVVPLHDEKLGLYLTMWQKQKQTRFQENLHGDFCIEGEDMEEIDIHPVTSLGLGAL